MVEGDCLMVGGNSGPEIWGSIGPCKVSLGQERNVGPEHYERGNAGSIPSVYGRQQ